MKIDIRVLLGLGVVGAVGYYFWSKSKNKPADTPNNFTEKDKPKEEITQNEYFAKEDITFGNMPDSKEPNVIIRKGDAVVGQQISRGNAFGIMEKGIMAKPTVNTAILPVGGSGLFFVPFSKIEIKTTTKYFIKSGSVTRPVPQIRRNRLYN
jgi:hypothetical protein